MLKSQELNIKNKNKKYMKSKLSIVNYQLSIIIILFFALPVKAQVNVGSADVPHPFSILELTTALKQGGLRLPRLSNTDRDKLHPESDPAAAQGLVIYNTDNDCVEFWSGSNWVDLCADCVNPAQPSPIIGYSVVEKSATNLTYSVTAVPNLTYIWTVPEAVGTITGGQGTNIIKVNASSTASGPVPAGTISVTAASLCANSTASTLDVTVGCGAYVSSKTDWREFMCYNMGVTDNTADPMTASPAILGARYKWGTGLVALSAANDQANVNTIANWATATYGGTPPTTGANWNMTTANPCLAGYRVPTQTEWEGVIANNDVYYNTVSTWTDNTNYYSAGVRFGNSLFLLSCGYRHPSTGVLTRWNSSCVYWSSTYISSPIIANCLIVSYNYSSYTRYDLATGIPVRCIAE